MYPTTGSCLCSFWKFFSSSLPVLIIYYNVLFYANFISCGCWGGWTESRINYFIFWEGDKLAYVLGTRPLGFGQLAELPQYFSVVSYINNALQVIAPQLFINILLLLVKLVKQGLCCVYKLLFSIVRLVELCFVACCVSVILSIRLQLLLCDRYLFHCGYSSTRMWPLRNFCHKHSLRAIRVYGLDTLVCAVFVVNGWGLRSMWHRFGLRRSWALS